MVPVGLVKTTLVLTLTLPPAVATLPLFAGLYYYHLHDLHRIQEYLTLDTAVLVANAMMSSKLQYYLVLWYQLG